MKPVDATFWVNNFCNRALLDPPVYESMFKSRKCYCANPQSSRLSVGQRNLSRKLKHLFP